MKAPCRELHVHLDGYLSSELPEQIRLEVQRHLESCPQCTAELAARTRLRAQLQTAVRATAVPSGLEANVRRALQHSRPRTGLWAVAAAAAVVIGVALAGLWRTPSNPEDAILRKTPGRMATLFNVGLRDHLQCAVFRNYSKQPIPATEMAADLGPEFTPLAPLIQAKLPAGFRIIQAHLCSAAGRQYTHFIIYGGGKLVSVILTRRRPNEVLGDGIHQTGVDRFQVVGFETGGYLAYVISDLDAGQNLQWAANLAPTLREYLATPSAPWGHLGSRSPTLSAMRAESTR